MLRRYQSGHVFFRLLIREHERVEHTCSRVGGTLVGHTDGCYVLVEVGRFARVFGEDFAAHHGHSCVRSIRHQDEAYHVVRVVE